MIIFVQPFSPLVAFANESDVVLQSDTLDVIELPQVPDETAGDDAITDVASEQPEVSEDESQEEANDDAQIEDTDSGTTTENTEESPEDSIGEQNAEPAEDFPVYNVTQGNETFYQFDRSSCVPVGDGSFYCSHQEQKEASVVSDNFFSAPDSDGDLEIFAQLDGEYLQITDNTYDDASPYYDATSNTLVWHRLIDDRYQIVSYDVEKGKEKVLTNDTVNNMEPTRFGDTIVWQRWVSNNWEIMLYDGDRAVQLTSNIYNDVAPNIRGEYIMWRTLVDNEQVVSVYDILTKVITVIDGEEAENSLSNPRMVLVYDSVTADGDIVTKGFDPVTGELMPLTSVPPKLPKEIPKSDQTGETRALLQNKLQQTGKESIEQDSDGDTTGLIIDPNTGDTGALDLSASSTDDVVVDEYTLVIPATLQPPVSVNDENTLVIPTLTPSSTVSQE